MGFIPECLMMMMMMVMVIPSAAVARSAYLDNGGCSCGWGVGFEPHWVAEPSLVALHLNEDMAGLSRRGQVLSGFV